MKRRTLQVAILAGSVGLLVTGAAGGYWWALERTTHETGAGQTTPNPTEREILYWYDPMVPDQHFDKPGKSPYMDMQLVPKYADRAGAGAVRIDAGLQQSVGIRTAEVDVDALPSSIRVPGTLSWDLRLESIVTARVDAVVMHVFVKAPYLQVQRGEPLVNLLAPGWLSALAETAALDHAESESARALQQAARERLRVLGIEHGADSDGNIAVLAPADGIVTEVLAREGQTVTPGIPLFRINGTGTLWLEAAVPQSLASELAPGATVEAHLDAFPGETYHGNVEALLPQVDAASRTQRVRIVLPNPDGRLAAGMFAEVSVLATAGTPRPLVPTEALILTGDDSRVIVTDGNGAFRPVRVRTGRSGGGRTEILDGLQGGERIVVSGQFLIDSEASLTGALERLGSPASGDPATPHSPGSQADVQGAPQ